MAWLSGWDKRVKLTIDQNDITAALSNFPILVYISASSGRNNGDVSCVFDELTLDANRKKIAVTKSDGTTECYVEIEKWIDADEKAWLWVKVPNIASDADTDLYLYYDKDHADNTAYVGDPSDAIVHNVWDVNHKLVTHMRDDPDTSHIRDSTVNANDGAKKGAGEPAVTTDGKIDDAQDFDGIDDYIDLPDIKPVSNITVSAIVKLDSTHPDNYPKVIDWEDDNYGWQLYYVLPDGYIFMLNADASVAARSYIPTKDVCYHLTGVYDGSNVYIYVDGVFKDSNGNTGNINYAALNTLRIGTRGSDARHWKGPIDEVRISDIARSPAWIKASYESEIDDLLDFGSEETAPTYIYFTATASATSSITATLTLGKVEALTGTSSATSSITATLTLGKVEALTGTSFATSSITASLTLGFTVTASATSSITATLTLGKIEALTGTSSATTSVTATLTLGKVEALTATSSAVSITQGSLTVVYPLLDIEISELLDKYSSSLLFDKYEAEELSDRYLASVFFDRCDAKELRDRYYTKSCGVT